MSSYQRNCFLTQSYKGRWIHSCCEGGATPTTVQDGGTYETLRRCASVHAAKIFITRINAQAKKK